MKKYIFVLLLLSIMFIPMYVSANVIGDFYKDINVSLNCDKCGNKNDMEIHLKLFSDNQEVEGSEIVLNKSNNFNSVFESLPIFKEDGITENNYEIRFLEDGVYKKFSNNDIKYNKVRKSQWVSVMPQDIVPGEDYVLMTDNWFHDYNERDPFILLDGDMYHQYVWPYPEYNIINGKKSYFSLDSEPEERTIWHFEKLDPSDELYSYYQNYWVLTNYKGEQLTLAGYMGDGSNSYFYKPSTKSGPIDYKTYANRVNIIPIENELSRFNINSKAYWTADHLTTLYLGIGSYVEVQAQREQQYGAHFIAFKYIENEEVEEVYNVKITRELCRAEEDRRTVIITDQLDISNIFNDIPEGVDIKFKIANPDIVRMDGLKIIPLKVGSTDISFDYAYTTYKLRVNVYDEKNPNTGINYILFISLFMIIALGITYKYKKRIDK